MNQSISMPPSPFEPERVLEMLAWLRRQTPAQRSATFDYLQSVLGELPNAETVSLSAETDLPPFDPQATIAMLQTFYEGDPEEHRQTLEALMSALNETRTANGERLLFPDGHE